MLSRKSVILAALLPLVALASGTAQSEQTPPSAPSAWKLAIVFARKNGQRTYVGTVDTPALPAGGPAAVQPASLSTTTGSGHSAPADPQADYEVWLVRDGATRGVWVSTSHKQAGEIDKEGHCVAARTDAGALQSLIRSAQPISYHAIPKKLYRNQADYFLEANSLEQQCKQADKIVLGQVVGVLRNVYTPERASLTMQHTVYVVAVEADLKHDAAGSPAIVKVRMEGGLLPGHFDAPGAESGEEMDLTDPLLDVGARYCLFLNALGQSPAPKKLGFVPTFYGGKPVRSAELDEYAPLSHSRAKILLKDGFARAPRTIGAESYDHWRFGDILGRPASGPQILDVPESDALEAIRQAITP